MSAIKPVYSRPSDDEPAPAPKRKRHRKHTHRNKSVHTTDTLTASPAKEIAEHNPLHEDDGVTKRDPTTEAKGMAKRHPLQDDGDAVAEHHPTDDAVTAKTPVLTATSATGAPTTERNAALANSAPKTNGCIGVSPRSTTRSASTRPTEGRSRPCHRNRSYPTQTADRSPTAASQPSRSPYACSTTPQTPCSPATP